MRLIGEAIMIPRVCCRANGVRPGWRAREKSFMREFSVWCVKKSSGLGCDEDGASVYECMMVAIF